METQETRQKQPLVSVVIPAHNEEKWIATCLESVLKTDDYPNKEVIVVDDASSDGTSDILKLFPVKVIRNEKSAGPSSARNIGVREAKGEVIVFIDAHCIVDDPEWIRKFLEFFSDPKVGAVGGYFKPKTGAKRTSLAIRSGPRIRLVKSANAAYRKSVFEQVRGFSLGVEWGGDADLTYKVHKSGWKTVHSRDITIVHADKIWPVKKAFFYGTCYFPIREKFPRLGRPVRGLLISPMVVGILLTSGLVTDLIFRLPVFTLTSLVLVSLLNAVSAHVSFPNGLYTTIWCFAYYLGAVYGAARDALSNGVGYFRRLWIRAQNLDKDRFAS